MRKAASSDILSVVSFCSATAPLTFSKTGRIAAIACEIRCTASTEPAASFCSASIFLVISLGGVLGLDRQRLDLGGDHTAKPRPASPARAASMVELSPRSVVCLAICAIRLTTLPMAADDPRERPTLEAGLPGGGALASSASFLLASRTWDRCLARNGWLSAACEKVVAVPSAAVPVRPVSALVRLSNGAESVVAVASAPSATEWGRAFELPDHGRPVRVRAVRGFPWRNRAVRSAKPQPRSPVSPPPVRRSARPVPADAFETIRTPWANLKTGKGNRMLAVGRETMVNNCPMDRQRTLPVYRKLW